MKKRKTKNLTHYILPKILKMLNTIPLKTELKTEAAGSREYLMVREKLKTSKAQSWMMLGEAWDG